jgi:hypothetical protein
MPSPINAKPAILLTLMVAFVAGLGWAMLALSKNMEFSSFLIFGVVTNALMIIAGFGWDFYVRRRLPEQ